MPNVKPLKHVLSKTTFMYGMQCTRRLWLQKFLRAQRDKADELQTALLQHGTDIGLLAQQLFPGGMDASPLNLWSYHESVKDTQRFIRTGHEIIYEAAFQFDGILCLIDILVKKNNKWYAFEVKGTNSVKPAHILDASLQYYVITQSGLELEDISIVHLNRDYIRKGPLDISQLFTFQSILKNVHPQLEHIHSKSAELMDVVKLKSPPLIEMGEHCNIPYPCDFQNFCSKDTAKKEVDYGEMFIDKNAIFQFVSNVKYPIFLVDINYWMTGVPLNTGDWSYKRIPFQYSVYRQNSPDESPEYFHYLADGTHSSQALFNEKLQTVLGNAGTVFLYDDSFDAIKYNAYKSGDNELKINYEALQKRIINLSEPFLKSYRLPEMKGSSSLMNVFLTSFPDSSLDFKKINHPQNAASAFFNLKDELDLFKISEVRNELLTFSKSMASMMMKIFIHLFAIARDEDETF